MILKVNKPQLPFVIYATPDAMLTRIHNLDLGNGACKHDTNCQDCGFGRYEPFSDECDHEPSCVFLQIDEYLKEIGRI